MEWRCWRYILPLRLRSIFRGGAVEQELDGELRFHLACKVEEEMSRGLDAHEAHYQALRAIDGLQQRKEEMRDLRHVRWFSDFGADLRYAVRALGHAKLLTVLLMLTLGLGIGVNSAMFSLAVSLLSALVCGLAPALQTTRTNLLTALKRRMWIFRDDAGFGAVIRW